MKATLIKLFFFSLGCIAISIIADELLPYYYGNKHFVEKADYYEKNKDDINLVVFGSSRIHEQFLPTVFDTAMHRNVVSFNFGTMAAGNPETYILYENFIHSVDSGSVQYAILEIQELIPIANRNIFTARASYIVNPSELSYTYQYLNDANRPWHIKAKIITKMLLSGFYRLINLQKLEYLLKNNPDDTTLKYRGCAPHFEPLKDSTELALVNEQMPYIKAAAQALDDSSSVYSTINNVHLSRLLQLQLLSKTKGVKLFFLLTPKNSDYTLLAGFESKLETSFINLARPSKYGVFYEKKMAYDAGHLNYEGSILFSNFLAKEVKAVLEKEKQ